MCFLIDEHDGSIDQDVDSEDNEIRNKYIDESRTQCRYECRCGVLDATCDELDDMADMHPDKLGTEFLEEIHEDLANTHSGYHSGEIAGLKDMICMLRRMRDRDEDEMDCWDNLLEADERDIAYRQAQLAGLDLEEFDIDVEVVPTDTQLIQLVDDITVLVQRTREVIKYIEMMSGDEPEIIGGSFSRLLRSLNATTEQIEQAVRQEIASMIDNDPKRLVLHEDNRICCHPDCPWQLHNKTQHQLPASEMASVCWLPYAQLLCTQALHVFDDLEDIADQLDEADDIQHGLRAQTTTEMLEFVHSMLSASRDEHDDEIDETTNDDSNNQNPSVQPANTWSCNQSSEPNHPDNEELVNDTHSLSQTNNQSIDTSVNQSDNLSVRSGRVGSKRKREGVDIDIDNQHRSQSKLATLMRSIQKHAEPFNVDDTDVVEGHELITDLLRERFPDEDVIRLIIRSGIYSHDAATQFLADLHDQFHTEVGLYVKQYQPSMVSQLDEMNTLRTIAFEQLQCDLVLDKSSFAEMVREILPSFKSDVEIEEGAIDALQHASEQYLLQLLISAKQHNQIVSNNQDSDVNLSDWRWALANLLEKCL